jgi:uncharacterized protein YggU (UPF0235/DUF167 family)
VKNSDQPVDGAANAALIDLLADALHVPRRDLSIVAGDRGRTKRVAVAGRTAASLDAALAPLLSRG